MLSRKNNNLKISKNPKLGNSHNRREKLNMSKTMSKKMIPHLITNAFPKKIKFVAVEDMIPDTSISHIYTPQKTNFMATKISTLANVIKWLESQGYSVKSISNDYYLFENKTVTESFLMVIANRKRIKQKLPPFVLERRESDL